MGILAFRHVAFEDIGLIRPALEARGIAIEYADLYQTDTRPATAAFDALIFMGGPMSVNDPLPYLAWEMQAIREAAGRGQPVLGICLGSQLIAKAMGAQVYRNPEKEIGWFDIRLTDAAAEDAVLGGMPASAPVFHWHGETFDLPHGACLLASSERCRNQAFRLGETMYGLQFHLEVTPAMIADWCGQDANSNDVKELNGPVDAERNAAGMERMSTSVFGRWCDLLQRRPAVSPANTVWPAANLPY